MNRNTVLFVLAATGCALCWWPAAVEPSIDFPRGILLVLIALITGLSTILSHGRWTRSIFATIVGTFSGMFSSAILFPPSDGIARSYVGFAIAVGMLLVIAVSSLTGLVSRLLPALKEVPRRIAWVAFVCCVVTGPVTLAMTPPLVARRIERNERMAAERFESLKVAVQQTLAVGGTAERICDGQTLRTHYSGPPFSDEDWQRIARNYVKQDGYVFGISCRGNGGYGIHAWPARGNADGFQEFRIAK